MKPEILNNDHMMFLDRALDTQRTALLTAMADAVAECRTAADQAAELTETGEIGLLRLVEILCAAKVQRGQSGGAVLEGTEVQILADALAQLYACLTECRFVGPMGLAAYAELSGMMASLMLGEWFDYHLQGQAGTVRCAAYPVAAGGRDRSGQRLRRGTRG